MCSINSDVIYKFISSCNKDDFLPEELRYRGMLTLLEYISCNVLDENKIYLDYLFFRRLDIECREMFKDFFISLYSKKQDIIDEIIVDRLEAVVNYITEHKAYYKDSASILLVDSFNKNMFSIKTLYKYLKQVLNGLILIHIPNFSYLLNIISLVSNEKYLDSLRSLFSDINSHIIFLDSYDAYVFNKLNICSSKASSLSIIMKNLIFNMDVYLEKTYDMNIGVMKTCSSILEEDYANYMEVIKTIPNINVTSSKQCIVSGYFDYIQMFYPNNALIHNFMELFRTFNSKIILTYDPYLYEYLVKHFKGKTYVIGFLPNLIVRFMKKMD